MGAGRINFYRALNAQQKPNIVIQKITFQNTRQNKKLIPDELVSIFVELKNLSFSAKNISIQLFSNNKNVHLINSEDFIPNLNFQAEYKNIHNPLKILIDKNIIPTPKTEIILQIKANNDFSLVKNYPIPMGVDQPKNLRTTIDSVNLKQVPEFLFFPENDNLIALGDSILLRIESQNLSNKKIKVQWKINNVIVNNDSSYFLLKDSSPLLTGQDTIQVSVFGEQIDSSIVHSWFITKEEPVKKLIEYSFFPRADTSISAGDSIQFSFNLKNYAGDSLNYQWFLNDSVMSVAYDSLFIYSPLSDSIKKDTIRVVVSNEDTVLIHEWIIKYILKTPTSEDIFYYPISDTSIFEGDTLKLGVKLFSRVDSLINFSWSVNNFVDSTDTSSSYLMAADFFSSGIDTVYLFFEKGDSLYKHQWIINIQNKNRSPQILSRTTVLDTTLTLDDQMYYSVEVFDPDSDSFTYSWALNSIVDSSATDSFYIYFSENNFSESDTLQLKISDADTSLTIDWIIRHSININHPPQIISATPRLDLILTKSDSVEFKISCFDEDGDSLQFKWLRNNIIDTTAIDSFYFYYLNDPEQSSDSITVLVFDGDTSTFAQWILFPDSTFDNPPISRNPIIFYPEMDTLFAEKDSLNFIISNLPDSIDVQWSINNRNDSTATDSSFIYYLPDKGNTIDTIQVRLTSQDTLFSHEWYIYYPELSVQKDSLRLAFFPEKETINFSTNDSLKFFVQLKAGNLSDINIHWFVNHELDEVNSDTCFFFMPDTSITRIDTITVLITHSDTTIVNNWAIQYEPVLKLPAPVLLYPIEGNQISEFETLSWENDSSLAAIDSTTKWKYVVQLSNDSTFSEIFSTDTCSVSSLTFNELEGFKKIFIKAPIYWRVKLFLEQNKISEFIKIPLQFYYFPMFVTL